GVMRSPGYPERHWKYASQALLVSNLLILTASAIVVLVTLSAVWGYGSSSWTVSLVSASLIDVAAFLLLFRCVGWVYNVLYHVAVVPYFQERIGEIDTFGHGSDLARH